MGKIPNDVVIVVNLGYDRFVLPRGTSADDVAILANAKPIDESYVGGQTIFHPSVTEKSVDVSIIDTNRIQNFIDARNDKHAEYDIIVEEVESRLKDQEHRVVFFREKCIHIGTDEMEYVDLANPDNDPEKIINKIVYMALQRCAQ